MTKSYAEQLADVERRVRVIYISSYIPRGCGIATFTKDLTSSINVLNPHCLAEIVAVNPPDIQYDYPWEVKFRFDQEEWRTYTRAADYINQSSAEIVALEHEFGLFGNGYGEAIVPFLQRLKKPVVTTFHTVLPTPDQKRRKIVRQIADASEAVIVMINAAADRLVEEYGIERRKIVVIPHGVPDITFSPRPVGKGRLRLTGRVVLSTFGLINAGKGIEHAIMAMPEILKSVPEAMYLVLGETHPVVKRHQGERYRRSLQTLVRQLGLQKHVRFANRYLTLDELITFLQATDIYITPYLNPDQITSGTLAYAVGAGLPCVSTPYIYAREVLGGGRGVSVDFASPKAIAATVTKLALQPDHRMKIRKAAYAFGRQMTWDNVALKHLDLFDNIVTKRKRSESAQ